MTTALTTASSVPKTDVRPNVRYTDSGVTLK